MGIGLTRKPPAPYPPHMPKLAMAGRAYALGAALLLPALCLATDVRVVAVTPGQSADVVIEGRAPITIDIGETVDGGKLLRADPPGAVMNVHRGTKTLPLVSDSSVGGIA